MILFWFFILDYLWLRLWSVSYSPCYFSDTPSIYKSDIGFITITWGSAVSTWYRTSSTQLLSLQPRLWRGCILSTLPIVPRYVACMLTGWWHACDVQGATGVGWWGDWLHSRGLIRGILTFPCDDHSRPSNATWARDLCTFSGTKLEKNNKVRYNMTQIASLLAVAVFIDSWAPFYSQGGGAYTRHKSTYAGTWVNRLHAKVWRTRSVIAKLILGGVKYYIPCDCQGSYLQDASHFVWTSLYQRGEWWQSYRLTPKTTWYHEWPKTIPGWISPEQTIT